MIFKGIFYPAHLASLNPGRVYRTEPGKHPFFFGNWLTAIYENSTNLSSLFCAFAHKKDNCCWGKAPLVISPNSWVLLKDSAKNFKLILLSCEFWIIEKIHLHDKAKSHFNIKGFIVLFLKGFVIVMSMPFSETLSYDIFIRCFHYSFHKL
jgi:hypothetical protein